MRYRPALLCIAFLLAGCAAFGGGATTDAPTEATTATETTASAAAETATATATPTDPASVDDGAYPPGIGPDGVVNATALEQATRRSLLRDGYAATVTRTTSNGSATRESDLRAVAAAGGFPHHSVRHVRVDSGAGVDTSRRERWVNETYGLNRYGDDGEVEYQPGPGETVPERFGLFDVVESGSWTVTAVRGPVGDRRFVLRATNGSDAEGSRVRVEAYHGLLVVDEEGTVRRANITADLGTPRGRLDWQLRYDLAETGRETVERPRWVDQELRAALNVSIRATAVDGRFVRVENDGRATVEPGSGLVFWYGGCGRATGDLEAPLEPGETVFIYVDNSSGGLGFDRTGPEGPAESISHPDEVIIYPPSVETPATARAEVIQADESAATTTRTAGSSAALVETAGVGATVPSAVC